MSKDLKSRRKKVNLENMDPDTQEATGLEVGKKIGKIIDNASNDINSILGIYGLKARIAYQLVDSNGEPIKEYNNVLQKSKE